jgi:CsoR family transcriptional regulator, copper-sensing transcriptional repressor
MSDWDENKGRVLSRLKRAEGQVRAVIGMVEREDECEHVIQQMAAVRKALDRAFYDMIACLSHRELMEAGIKQGPALKRLEKITDLLARYG